MANNVVWVDIPVLDLKRAIAFYSNVLGIEIHSDFPGMQMGVFASEGGEASGCLYVSDGDNRPSRTGPLIYLNAEGRLKAAVAAVEAHGGKVVEPIHAIGPHGFRALVLDSEGNRIALHGMTDR